MEQSLITPAHQALAFSREQIMKITIVKGKTSAKPSNFCPWVVDDIDW
jgi:hypothetical protein